MSQFHPAVFLLFGALLALLPKGFFRHCAVLLAPVLALLSALNLQDGTLNLELGGFLNLNLYALTIWNKPFAVAFCLVAFLGLVYARPLDRREEDCAALIYAAAAVGAVLAGDLFTFYCCWEVLALSATILVFGGRNGKARRAGFRYLIYHVAGGLVLLFGILWRLSAGFDDKITEIGLDSPGGLLIFIGIGVNCAWPLLHTWLTDAYPEASVSGVLLSLIHI